MKKLISLICSLLLLQTQVFATVLPEGKAVIVQPQQEIDADDVKQGETIKFTTIQPIKENGKTLVKSGTEVIAQVTKKKNNFILGIPGEIEITNFKIYTPDNETIHLRGSIIDKGEGKYWAHIGWIFLFPLLFVKGNDAKIPASVQHTLYTIEDINL